MNVKIMATHSCSHRPNLERELEELGIPYELLFVEEHPEAVARYDVRHSPTLIVNDQVVLQGQPAEHELQALFNDMEDRDK